MGAWSHKAPPNKGTQNKQFLPRLRNIPGRQMEVVREENSKCLIDKLSLPQEYKYFIGFYLKDSLFNLFQSVGS